MFINLNCARNTVSTAWKYLFTVFFKAVRTPTLTLVGDSNNELEIKYLFKVLLLYSLFHNNACLLFPSGVYRFGVVPNLLFELSF